MKLNGEIILKNAPIHYPHQEGLTCGETNIRGILSGFNIPYSPAKSPRLRIRLFGYSFIQDISELLEIHGLSAPIHHANRLTDQRKLEVIQDHIYNGEPVLLAIGNGYLQRGEYTPLARYFIGHFITIYGYSDREKVFYIYDPYLKDPYPGEIPVGNETRTYQELLRDWQGPFYYKLIGMDHVFIPAALNDK
jgi:hypothetical protein